MRFSFKPKTTSTSLKTKFAWYPIKTEEGSWAFMERVRVKWNAGYFCDYPTYHLMGGIA